MKNSKQKSLRIPRPLGATQMVNAYSKLSENEKVEMREKMIVFFIHHWFLSNGNISGINYSQNDLALFLKVDISYIQLYMRDQVVSSKIWDKDIQKELLEGLLGQQLAWTFEDRMEVQNQLELLKRSQGGRYAPFISSEVNKALKLKLETTTSLQSLVRSFTGGGQGSSINIFNQFNQQNNGEKDGVTTREALEIIQEEQRKIPENERDTPALYIEAKYDLADLPEVCALNQEGVNTEKEGLNLGKNDLNLITDNYKGAIELAEKEFKELESEINPHSIRRQIEYNEDMDADDPELEIYDE